MSYQIDHNSLTIKDIELISDLYKRYIPESLLSRLRPSLLRGIIRYAYDANKIKIIVLREMTTSQLYGFLIYSLDNKWISSTLKHHRLFFIKELIDNIMNINLIKYIISMLYIRLINIIKIRGYSELDLTIAELFAIVITKQLQGNGFAIKLINAMETQLTKNGFKQYEINTLNINESSNKLYCKIGAKFTKSHQNPNGLVNSYLKIL